MGDTSEQDQRYSAAAAEFGPALERLARGYEANADKRRDLVQDIHFALWRSLAAFDGRCSLRTWIYRVAHNTATTHILKERRQRANGWIGLDEDWPSDGPGLEDTVHEQQALARLTALIQRLHPQDRQIMLLYLENVDASGIADITGLKAPNVATKIHRIKALLSRQFHQGGRP
ncbi:MAG TPA: sigma-70 family RNA polymerase sigma factor [Asticcacaulis sp.]|nr:sigma-70 family RNA polymerase sigma factor [Asticcacaulis sp.]